uniref:SCP domain-containing protein n=1 Tax=Clastoptera arizonana TaxID=38151 RepID=A0A1B6CI62_9HEMI
MGKLSFSVGVFTSGLFISSVLCSASKSDPYYFGNIEKNIKTLKRSSRQATSELSDYDKESIRQEILDAHNYYRSLHGTQSLQLINDMNSEAQSWAEKLARNNMFMHSNTEYGENLYLGTYSDSFNGQSVVDLFYKEISDYTFGQSNPDNSSTGHFTQVVWASTLYLGVGMALQDTNIIVVCQYDPPGNVAGQYDENVPPPSR